MGLFGFLKKKDSEDNTCQPAVPEHTPKKYDPITAFYKVFLAAAEGDADAQKDARSLSLENRKDSAAFLEMVEKDAQRGDANAQFLCGYLYFCGLLCRNGSFQPDKEKGFRWFTRAAEQGHGQALYYCGKLYTTGAGLIIPRDLKKAFECYKSAAEAGVADAQYRCADYYCYGKKGVERDYAKYIFLLKQAANQGHEGAQYKLGVAYEKGVFVDTVDSRQALEWYTKAALQGNANAMTQLGTMYAEGNGTPADIGQAISWLKKAVEQPDCSPYAFEELEQLLNKENVEN